MTPTKPKALCVALSAGLATEVAALLAPDFDAVPLPSVGDARTALNDDADFALLITDASQHAAAECLELQRLRQTRRPDTVGIMVVAENALETALAALQDGSVYRVIRSPWQSQTLATTLAEARAYFDMREDERRLREQLARINSELDEKIQDLDEAKELLEYWVEFSPAVLYSLSCDDGQLHPSYISKNFHRLTGFERTAAVVDAGFWRELVHPGDAQRYRDALSALTLGEDNFAVVEYRVRHRDGNYLTVVDSMRAVRDGDGNTIEAVGAWMDVRARA